MSYTRLDTRGGEFEYSAPKIDIIDVRIEQGFAKSSTSPEAYDDWGGAGGAGGIGQGSDHEL